MHKSLLLLTFILLCNISFAVGTEGLVKTPPSKVSVLKKMQKRLLVKKLNKLLAQVDTIDYDLIHLYSGETIHAYVLDIQGNKVLYKNHNHHDIGIETLTCTDVSNIILNNGTIYGCSHLTQSKRSSKAKFKVVESIDDEEFSDQELAKDRCDIIKLHNDRTINVTVLEINNKKIIFETCNESEVFVDSMTCRQVDVLILADGTTYSCSNPNASRRSENANFVRSPENIQYRLTHQCDLLILMNKDQLDVQIEAIRDKQIFYKSCRDSSSVTQSISLDDVRTYRTKDGYSQRVNQYLSEQNQNRNRATTTLLRLLLIILALSILPVILVGLLIWLGGF